MKTIKKIRIDSFPKRIDEDTIGEELITKIRRVLDENEPLTDGAPLIYTPKEKGVIPEYNIRTDKWQLAMGAMDRVSEYKLSEYMKKSELKTEEGNNETSNTTGTNATNENNQSA